jgi:hypothetical protein
MSFEKEQINLMKRYINYDKLVDELVNDKNKQILKAEIEILGLQEMIKGLHNDIIRIETEREQSNLGNIIHYIFINPNYVYHKLLKEFSKRID